MACTGRQWCDFVCWTPNNGSNMWRIHYDDDLFRKLLPYYRFLYELSLTDATEPPALRSGEKQFIKSIIADSMSKFIDYDIFKPKPLTCISEFAQISHTLSNEPVHVCD